MVDPKQIREHMPVIGSDGAHVGTVDAVEGDRIKLTKDDSRDGTHHYVPVTAVARVDEHVHLAIPAISAIPGGAASEGGEAAAGIASPLPSVLNRAVEGAEPRRNFYLPWIVGIVGLVLLFFLLKSCVGDRDAETTAPTAQVQAGGEVAGPATLAGVSGLGAFLGGGEATPRSFAFERLNFDTGSNAIRPADRDEIAAVAAVLKQYGSARISIAGYADARGPDPANVRLAQSRADAVKVALIAQGIDAARIDTVSGGEGDPVDTNASAAGRAGNRRTELVVTRR
jgi:outer membrane protein OmpA-like peptidoglycan-associated protein